MLKEPNRRNVFVTVWGCHEVNEEGGCLARTRAATFDQTQPCGRTREGIREDLVVSRQCCCRRRRRRRRRRFVGGLRRCRRRRLRSELPPMKGVLEKKKKPPRLFASRTDI